jgi:probable F420-dependent oxidoreductase
MRRPFRFAVQGRGFDDLDEVIALARLVESLGYDELYSYDHVGAVDPFIPLVVAAQATTRLRVGPLVLNNEFHHPALLARTAATVDRLTGGRLVLGIGTGYQQSEHDAIGLQLRPPGERVSRLAESLFVLRALLGTGSCNLDGEHHRIELDDLGIRPLQAAIPLLIGGHGRRVVTIAGHYADIFQFTGLTGSDVGDLAPGGFGLAALRERSRWLSDAAGDRDAAIERSALVQLTHVGDGADERIAETAAQFDVTPELIGETPFVLIGSVEQVVDKIQRLRDELGISHFVVREATGFAPVVEALAGS